MWNNHIEDIVFLYFESHIHLFYIHALKIIFVNTLCILNFEFSFTHREEVDKAQDQAVWKLEIEEEIEELRDEHEREYKRKMLTYEEEMARYQKQQQAKVNCCQRFLKYCKKKIYM